MVPGVSDRIAHAFHDFFPGKAISFHLDVTGRNLEQHLLGAQLDVGVKVGDDAARKAPDFRGQTRIQHAPDGFGILIGNPWKSGFNAAHSKCSQFACNLEFFVGGEHHADGLFTVAQVVS